MIKNQLLVIFGASGDLTARKLMPSLFELYIQGFLPKQFAVVGVSRTVYSDIEYRQQQRTNIKKMLGNKDISEDQLDNFAKLLFYVPLDTEEALEYHWFKNRLDYIRDTMGIDDNIIFYLSTPPFLYKPISSALMESGLNISSQAEGIRRIIIEKPFGVDLNTAKELNAHLKTIFKEEEIYRIDHYLGKETVQNILVLRFSNGIFEPLWNRNYIDSIEITATELLGVGNRGGYYDNIGALRDMIQNHLMHLMSFIAMESPSVFEPESIRDEILKVFKSIHHYKEEDIDSNMIRGQYEGYLEEKDVSPDSSTETYVSMKLGIDNWRWSGVPIYLRTGKKLKEKVSEIIINFKTTPHQIFVNQCSKGTCNKLIIKIQPDESISLSFGLKKPGAGFSVRQVGMDFRYDSMPGSYLPDAYERLLLDAMNGDSTLYSRSDALEASWSFVDSILRYWKEIGSKGLVTYSDGDAPIIIPNN